MGGSQYMGGVTTGSETHMGCYYYCLASTNRKSSNKIRQNTAFMLQPLKQSVLQHPSLKRVQCKKRIKVNQSYFKPSKRIKASIKITLNGFSLFFLLCFVLECDQIVVSPKKIVVIWHKYERFHDLL